MAIGFQNQKIMNTQVMKAVGCTQSCGPRPDYEEINESHGIIQMALSTCTPVYEGNYDSLAPGKVFR